LFYVLDYKGQPNLCYINAQAQSCSLHHAVHVDEIERDMSNTVFVTGDLYRTIYESDPGVKVAGSKTNMENARAMLSLAVKSYWDMDRNSKVRKSYFSFALFEIMLNFWSVSASTRKRASKHASNQASQPGELRRTQLCVIVKG
jgi:hypothetical protein